MKLTLDQKLILVQILLAVAAILVASATEFRII